MSAPIQISIICYQIEMETIHFLQINHSNQNSSFSNITLLPLQNSPPYSINSVSLSVLMLNYTIKSKLSRNKFYRKKKKLETAKQLQARQYCAVRSRRRRRDIFVNVNFLLLCFLLLYTQLRTQKYKFKSKNLKFQLKTKGVCFFIA